MRSRTIAYVLAGGALAVLFILPTWLTASVVTVTGTQLVTISGLTAAPSVAAASATIAVGAAALTTANRRVARLILALMIVSSSVGIAMTIATYLRAEQIVAEHVSGTGELSGSVAVSWFAFVSLGALVWACCISVWGFSSVARWEFATTRFDARTAHATDQRVQAMDDWDALSTGEDPSEETGSLGTNRGSS